MAKKTQKRGRPFKKKRVASRAPTASAPAKATRAVTGSSSGPGAGVEPCLIPWPSLRRVSSEALPRMGTVKECKDEEAGIRILGCEDLDALQLELETLLSSVVVRLSQMNDQLTVLKSLETVPSGRGRKQRKTRAVISAPAPSPAPTPPNSDDKLSISRPPVQVPIKKLGKVPPTAPSPNSSPPPCKRSKMLKKRPDVAPKTKPRGKQLEKDFVSHKFWNALDPYCCDISNDTYNVICDTLSQNQTEVPLLYNIPPLGEHFTKEWDLKNLMENQDSCTASSSASSPTTSNSPVSPNTARTSESIGSAIRRKFRECSLALKRTLCTSAERLPPPVSPPPTPATSKLMAALLGEIPPPVVPLQESKDSNVIVKVEKEEDDKTSLKTSRPNSVSSSSTSSDIPRKHQRRCLDRKFRLEKEALGEFETSSRSVVPSQSVLEELKRTQAELKLVVDQNSCTLVNLTNIMAKQFKIQNLKRKLQEVDDSVIDIYHTRTSAKLAKQTISQEDVDQAWKTLKERDQIIRQIEFLEHKWNSKTES